MTLDHLSPTDLREIDRTWDDFRRDDDDSAHWNWYEVSIGSQERFGLFADSEPLAVFSSSRAHCVMLNQQPCYRLDYVEVRGDQCGHGLGLLLLGVVCLRAAELSANAVVLGSTPNAVKFYKKAGAQVESRYWKSAPGLISLKFDTKSMKRLAGHADAFFEDED